MLRANIPFLPTSLLLTFQNLSYIIYSQGRERKGEDGSLKSSVKFLSDSLERREGRISKFGEKKKKNLNSVASARVNINSEMAIQEDVFISVERSNSKLSLIALCNPDASPASFIHLFKGT